VNRRFGIANLASCRGDMQCPCECFCFTFPRIDEDLDRRLFQRESICRHTTGLRMRRILAIALTSFPLSVVFPTEQKRNGHPACVLEPVLFTHNTYANLPGWLRKLKVRKSQADGIVNLGLVVCERRAAVIECCNHILYYLSDGGQRFG
jgi:hypothetical protein